MKIVIQRVSSASVIVKGEAVAKIDSGILALVGFGQEDLNIKFHSIVDKILKLRIFSNPAGRFDYSLEDLQGGIILVPQFTLYADTTKGRRPEFFKALPPKEASLMFEDFINEFRKSYPGRVEAGIFGADMQVALVNDGPVTISLDF